MTIDPRLDQTVGGKYRIVRFLAEGGMGSVYEAQHLVVKRRFAVKFLRSDLMRRRDVLARFRLEAEAAGAIESENIAAALDFGIAVDGAPYIVMEYLDGVDLGRLLSMHGPLPPERAADLVRQACSGAQRAHEAGVLHRDLKPRNLLLCRRSDGTDLIKIVDFGVAKLQAGEASNAVTRSGGLVGTPSYMSPEQARGAREVDARTDVYALGVILYELLSGRTPHPGDSYNAVIHHIATQPALSLEAAGHALPPRLIEIVERALASEVVHRQSSAAELGRELDAFARRDVWSPAMHELEAEAPLPSGRLSPAPGRRRPWPVWLLASMSLGILALLGVAWAALQPALSQTPRSLVAPLAPSAMRPPVTAEAREPGPPASGAPGAASPVSAPAMVPPRGIANPDAASRAPAAPAAARRAPGAPAAARRARASSLARARHQHSRGASFDPQNPYE